MKKCFVLLILLMAGVLSAVDLPTVWTGLAGEARTVPKITREKTSDGITVYRATPVVNGAYQGMCCKLDKVFDPKEYSGIEFVARQQVMGGKCSMVFRLDQIPIEGSPGRQSYAVVSVGNGWEKIMIPFNAQSWNAPEGADKLAPAEGLTFYPFDALRSPNKFIEIGDVKLLPKNDKSVRQLTIAKYSYVNKPTTGDERCNQLNDGDIKTGAYYRQYSNDAEIVFDLGAVYAVSKIDVDAFCPPGHNFTELRVMASSDKKNFSSWGTVKNTMDGGDEVEMRISGEGYAIGRYFKVRAVKIRPDFFTWIGEIRFHGYVPDAKEISDFQSKSYDLGPEIEAVSPDKYAQLDAANIKFNVNLKNSVVNGVAFNGKKIVERISNVYMIQTHSKDTEISGYDDKVVKVLERKNNSISLLCRNDKMPSIEIIKNFRITDGGDLTTEYRVKNGDLKEPIFLRIATKVVLEQTFRKDGFYETAGAGHYAVREAAKDVMISTAACNVPYLVFENFNDDTTIFHHRYSFDDKFLYIDAVTEEEKLLFFEPNGYQIPDATFALSKASERSVMGRIGFSKGNILNAYDKYYDLEETKKYRGVVHRPAWLRDILMTGGPGWQGPIKGKYADFMNNVNTMFLPRGRFIEAGSGELGWEWGEYPTEGIIRDGFGTQYTPDEVKQELQLRRDIRPGSKIGIYTWLWSNPPYQKIVKEHPEWFIFKTRGGSLASWFPGINTNLMRKWDDPASRQQAIDMEMAMIRRYNCESLYLDGGNAGSFAKDWTTMTIDSPHSKNYMYAKMREEVQKFNPEGYLMFNAPMNPFSDVGILENFAGAMTSEWHKGAMWMHKFKLFSYRDPLKCCFYVYWLSNVDGAYQNYMMGTGLMPAWCSRGLSFGDVPYTTARYEVRGVQIVNSKVTPNYRADNDCNVETMLQTQGQDALIFVNFHGKEPLTQKVTAEAAPFGFKADQTVYSFFNRFHDARKVRGIFGEPNIQKGYRQSKWIPDRAMKSEYLGSAKAGKLLKATFDLVPSQGAMWVTTPVPAVIWSADDLPAHSRMSQWPDMTIKGDYDKLTVDTEYASCEIAVIVPAGKKVASVKVDGADAAFNYVRDGRALFAVVPLKGAGKHEISVKTTALETPSVSLIAPKKLDASVEKGVLKVALADSDDAEKTLSIYLDGILAYGGVLKNNACLITLPETVRDGKYNVQAALLDGTVIAECDVELKGFAKQTPLINLMTHVPSEIKEDTCNVSRNGITMTRFGMEYTKGAGTCSVNPEKMALRVGMLPRLTTFFGTAAAGGEFTTKRFCKIKLTGNLKYYNNYGAFPRDHFVYNMNNRMAGIMFDFERKAGDFIRTLGDLGVEGTKRTSNAPNYCKLGKVPDYFFNINTFAVDKDNETMTLWLDLTTLGAPADWTGKVFISPMLDNCAPDRWFQVELLESADSLPAGEKAAKCFNRTATVEPKSFEIPALPAGAKVECNWESPLWKKVPALPALHPLGNQGAEPAQPTYVKIASDAKNLYVLYNCIEDPAKPAETSRGARGEPYFSDSIEFFFQLAENPERVMHCILDVAGHIYAAKCSLDPKKDSFNEKYNVPPFKYEIKKVKGDWHILITISRDLLAPQNTAFNVARNRNVDGQTEGYTLVPAKSYVCGSIYTIKDIKGKK